MLKESFKTSKDIAPSVWVEDNLRFSIEDHTEKAEDWYRFKVEILLNGTTSLGPLLFDTNSEHLLQLSEKFKEWSCILSKLEDPADEVIKENALKKLTEEEKTILGIK